MQTQWSFNSVDEAFENMVKVFLTSEQVQQTNSRNGPVLRLPGPQLFVYKQPCNRVLFNPARDCNPFFHLFESLWMLAGCNRVKPLSYYNSNITDYSDDGETFHGAYGYRWRSHFGVDQLKQIEEELLLDRESRRCVLQIWSSTADLGIHMITKDKPCNTHAYFALVNDHLDLTVCNRSNDLVWGMLGANFVHMTLLLEYMACCLNVPIGRYFHITNNLHVYLSNWRPSDWTNWKQHRTQYSPPILNHPMGHGPRLVSDQTVFDAECKRFVDSIDGTFQEPFLQNVAQPMMAAFRAHKQRKYFGDLNCFTLIDRVHAPDWREAGRQWLMRRKENWMAKNKKGKGKTTNVYLAREEKRQAANPDDSQYNGSGDSD